MFTKILNCVFSGYRYSGEMGDFGVKLDDFATFMWENVSIKSLHFFFLIFRKLIKIFFFFLFAMFSVYETHISRLHGEGHSACGNACCRSGSRWTHNIVCNERQGEEVMRIRPKITSTATATTTKPAASTKF